MTAERLLATLSVIAVGLLLTAIAVTGGKSPSPSGAALSQHLPSFSAFSSPNEGALFAGGLAAGWVLRWIYTLPWAAIPRAIIGWLLSWRWSVVMLGVAVGCMAILVLY